jgi:16S rRNA (cytosine1402-N4)-methyltransferase
MRRVPRSTPAGEHRAVLLDEVLAVLNPQPGQVAVDCTVGWGGHATEFLKRLGPDGKLIGIDLDAENLAKARQRLEEVGFPFILHHGNFAGLPAILAREGITVVNLLVADLGMSSMQVDDPARGFSYVRDGELDMRMDRSRGRTATQVLATIGEEDLRQALAEFGDEPEAAKIAAAIVAARKTKAIERTSDLARVVKEATDSGPWRLHPSKGKWNLHPAARTFQALRILVNRELANLSHLLRVLPTCLGVGGRAALISFHSGEDRLIKASFREGLHSGIYSKISKDPLRANFTERSANPRSRSAKLRWAQRVSQAYGSLALRSSY